MVHILSISTNQETLRVLDRLVNQNEAWTGLPAPDFASAKALLEEHDFDLALIGSGISAWEQQALAELLVETGKKTKLVPHFGGGSGLLYTEIAQALA